jgi:hypothetical protein
LSEVTTHLLGFIERELSDHAMDARLRCKLERSKKIANKENGRAIVIRK